MTVNLYLKDYLLPGGSRPYNCLVGDLESELKKGNTVYLWSVPGFLMVAGHPGSKTPWSNGKNWFKTAKTALKGK